MNIRVATLAEAWELYQGLPEFAGGTIAQSEFEHRLTRESALLLVVERDAELIGFSVGFDRYGDGSFYSWLGGVVADARRDGVAQALLLEQERRLVAAGFDRIYVKSKNRFVGMLTLLLNNGYGIVGVTLPDDLPVADGRLTLLKNLRG